MSENTCMFIMTAAGSCIHLFVCVAASSEDGHQRSQTNAARNGELSVPFPSPCSPIIIPQYSILHSISHSSIFHSSIFHSPFFNTSMFPIPYFPFSNTPSLTPPFSHAGSHLPGGPGLRLSPGRVPTGGEDDQATEEE